MALLEVPALKGVFMVRLTVRSGKMLDVFQYAMDGFGPHRILVSQ